MSTDIGMSSTTEIASDIGMSSTAEIASDIGMSSTTEIATDSGIESCFVTNKCISRIPASLCAGNKATTIYVPRMVSLGPIHTQVRGSETIKTKLLEGLDDGVQKTLIDKIMLRINIRNWYGLSQYNGSDEYLASRMVRDGLFLLQFLQSFESECPILVEEDIMKLENQIPMFVLHAILELKPVKDTDLRSILELAWQSLCPFIDFRCKIPLTAKGAPKMDSHLLRFMYENIIRSPSSKRPTKGNRSKRPPKGIQETNEKTYITLPSAVELKRAGVKFAKVGWLEEISFDSRNCTLHLPAIEMDSKTEAFMLNLLAFEEFVLKKNTKPLTCYVDMMDRLINTAEDVKVLKKAKIIVNHLSTIEEAASVWNGMTKSLRRGQYEPIDTAIGHVTAFSADKYRIMYAEFKHEYFSRPWLAVGLVAACIVTVSSVLQTIFAWQQVGLQRSQAGLQFLINFTPLWRPELGFQINCTRQN